MLHAAALLRDMTPKLEEEPLLAAVAMLQAVEAWQQAVFGGAHAVITQRHTDRRHGRGRHLEGGCPDEIQDLVTETLTPV